MIEITQAKWLSDVADSVMHLCYKALKERERHFDGI